MYSTHFIVFRTFICIYNIWHEKWMINTSSPLMKITRKHKLYPTLVFRPLTIQIETFHRIWWTEIIHFLNALHWPTARNAIKKIVYTCHDLHIINWAVYPCNLSFKTNHSSILILEFQLRWEREKERENNRLYRL